MKRLVLIGLLALAACGPTPASVYANRSVDVGKPSGDNSEWMNDVEYKIVKDPKTGCEYILYRSMDVYTPSGLAPRGHSDPSGHTSQICGEPRRIGN